MSRRFTYRELTLMFGIVVAFIIILTLWFRQPADTILNAAGILDISQLERFKNFGKDKVITAFAELVSSRNNPY